MDGVLETVSRNLPLEWDAVSGWRGKRKLCPGIQTQSGVWFPIERLGGKCIPEFMLGMGCGFRLRPLAESVSRN